METTIGSMNGSNTTISPDLTNTRHLHPVAITYVLLALTVWVLFSLIHYGIDTKIWRKSQLERMNSVKLSSGFVYSTVVFSASLCLLRYISTVVLLNVDFNQTDDELCNVLNDLTAILYTFVILSTYTFQWIRQRIFYKNKMLNLGYSKPVQIISLYSVIAIITTALTAIFYFSIRKNYVATVNGCMFVLNSVGTEISVFIASSVLQILAQLILFLLFAYAINPKYHLKLDRIAISTNRMKHSTPYQNISDSSIQRTDESINNICKDSSANLPALSKNTSISSIIHTEEIPAVASTITSKAQTRGRSPINTVKQQGVEKLVKNARSSDESIRLILRKTFYLAIATTITDVISLGLTYVLVSPDQRQFLVLVFNLNAFFNLILIIFSFVSWRDMLLSPCMKYFKTTK